MSLTLWHRQFRNPIFLVLWTCYSEVQLVTSASVSLLGALRAAWTFASSLLSEFSESLFNSHDDIWSTNQNSSDLLHIETITVPLGGVTYGIQAHLPGF